MATAAQDGVVRRRFEVRGIVQGVGFRPFVHRLARKLSLAGWVRNDAAGVTIEVEGDAAAVERLARDLRDDAPPLARVDGIARIDCARERPGPGFAILDSGGGRAATAIGPDTAICGDCLSEMLDPRDRRYRYAFINCTNCGPRYTITRRLPYDRALTSMSAFAQCGTCLAEYGSLRDRRFHAEPNACPVCGPKLSFLDRRGQPVADVGVVAEAIARIRCGEILAIKGLGGFHLACDARNAAGVARLRARKSRSP
jgi:hydrogenase maturation protein HypF